MKKVLLVLISCILLVGCGKKESDVVADVETTINGLNNYHLVGDLTIANNEDKYNYTVDVTYLKGDYYRVSLVNKENSHEQIILKNEEGVYVVTPSLNKSFKFQSEWPTNSSQSYILVSILFITIVIESSPLEFLTTTFLGKLSFPIVTTCVFKSVLLG